MTEGKGPILVAGNVTRDDGTDCTQVEADTLFAATQRLMLHLGYELHTLAWYVVPRRAPERKE